MRDDAMSRRNTAAAAHTRPRRASWAVIWAALALALSFALAALRPPGVWADGGGITIMPSAGGSLYVAGSSLTANFSTDAALNGNTPLTVTFVSAPSGSAIPATYAILSAAGTTYTARIPIPDLTPGEYTLVIEGQEINGGRLTSAAFTIVAPTPMPTLTPTPTLAPSLVPIGTQAHDEPPGIGGVPGGVIAAVAAGGLLLVSLALLLVPPLRRRGNQPPR